MGQALEENVGLGPFPFLSLTSQLHYVLGFLSFPQRCFTPQHTQKQQSHTFVTATKLRLTRCNLACTAGKELIPHQGGMPCSSFLFICTRVMHSRMRAHMCGLHTCACGAQKLASGVFLQSGAAGFLLQNLKLTDAGGLDRQLDPGILPDSL